MRPRTAIFLSMSVTDAGEISIAEARADVETGLSTCCNLRMCLRYSRYCSGRLAAFALSFPFSLFFKTTIYSLLYLNLPKYLLYILTIYFIIIYQLMNNGSLKLF